MRFSNKDKCIQCGSAVRPHTLFTGRPLDSKHGLIKPDGRCLHDYWFCSLQCLDKAVRDYLPDEFKKEYEDSRRHKDFLRTVPDEGSDDDLQYYQQRNQDIYNNWNSDRKEALQKARETIRKEIDAEETIIWEKDAAETRARIAERERFDAQLSPRAIPERLRSQHTHILAPSGFGKTTLIQQIILDDLRKDNPPGYVVIDPKGELIERISRLAVFDGRLKDRIVIVNPTDIQPPALSMFAMPGGINDPIARARVLNHLIETFAYIFSSSDARLTQRQGIPFAYVMRLVFQMGGDLNTLMDVLESTPNDPRFDSHIRRLAETDQGARRFFANDFHSKTFSETRQQIRARLYEIISKPDLMAMFAAPTNNLSLIEALQKRKIVLVNTALGQLGSSASALLGRYFISMTLNAAYSRFAIPKDQWHPTYLIIDEFQDFADEDKTPELLRLAREYNLGVVLAHQTMHSDELTKLRPSISTNTTIKYSSNPEALDLNYMARDLNCEPEFLKKYATPTATSARFATFARGMGLEHPFITEVPFGNIQAQPQMSEASYQALHARNRAALAPKPVIQRAEAARPIPAPAANPPEPPKPGSHNESGPTW